MYIQSVEWYSQIFDCICQKLLDFVAVFNYSRVVYFGPPCIAMVACCLLLLRNAWSADFELAGSYRAHVGYTAACLFPSVRYMYT